MFVRRRELRTPGKRAFPMKSVAELLGRCELIRAMFFLCLKIPLSAIP